MAENTQKTPKRQGPIRFEAVIPFAIVMAVMIAYFHFFFDLHLRRAFEIAGYHFLGAQVDIEKVETSFWKGTFRVRGIQLTNAEKPTHNMVQIGDVRFGVLWDGLLRARFIVDEMATEQIQIDIPRKSPGRVKPPEPAEPDSDGPSAAEKLKDKALGAVESKYQDNALGDLAAILGGTSSAEQIGKIEGSLASKARLKEIKADYEAKQKQWQARFASLPKGPELQALGDRLGKVKTKDFKSPQELQASLQEIDSILKEADAKFKSAQSAGSDLNTEIKALEQGFKDLEAMIKKDLNDLESRFRIPSLDAKSISQSIFYPYVAPYLAQFNRYQSLVKKYAPPNLINKDKGEEPSQIQPRPRAEGISYEFTKPRSYPMFWVKRISVSSTAGPGLNSGNINGLITDVTSNQMLVGRPTIAKLEGNFPSLEISDFFTQLTIDNTKELLRLAYDFRVGSYGLSAKELVQSPDIKIAFQRAQGSMSSKGDLVGLRDFKFSMSNQFQNVDYMISAPNKDAEAMIKAVFAGIPKVTLDANGSGRLPGLSLSINSNLGAELAQGFEKQINLKLAEAKAKLQAYVDEQVGKERSRLEAEFNKAKSQAESEIKKIQDQINTEKAKAQAKIDQSKKDSENQARKSVEDQLRKAIPDADKKVEDLKKRFGF
jgi:uncharacterized protein (TIGR03545 family)